MESNDIFKVYTKDKECVHASKTNKTKDQLWSLNGAQSGWKFNVINCINCVVKKNS